MRFWGFEVREKGRNLGVSANGELETSGFAIAGGENREGRFFFLILGVFDPGGFSTISRLAEEDPIVGPKVY